MKKVAFVLGFLQHLIGRLYNFLIVSLLILLVSSLNSCALIAHGPSQNVLVNSTPEGAKVFLEGEFIGTTPIKVTLKRSGTHNLRLVYGKQERVVIVKNHADIASIILDAIPLAIFGGLTASACIAYATDDNNGSNWIDLRGDICNAGLIFSLASATPLVVDAATESWHELSPKEVVVDFTE